MSYIMIRNPGVADHRALTLLGTSTTRHNGSQSSIGMFGSGFKYSCALLLREGIELFVVCGNLKMEFFSKPIMIQGNCYNQVYVKYSGKDQEGNSVNRTDDLGFVCEMGVNDWINPNMALREFIANAIDGSILHTGSFGATELTVADKPRAKADTTTVYIHATPVVVKAFQEALDMFLHFQKSDALNQNLLPKTHPEEIRFYKKGVLVYKEKGISLFDYNFDNEVALDESRNAKGYQVKWAAAQLLGKSDANTITKFLGALNQDRPIYEGHFDIHYLKQGHKKNWQEAWNKVFGEDAVATTGLLDDRVSKKGLKPIRFKNSEMIDLFESYGVKTERNVLDEFELGGRTVTQASEDMKKAADLVWNKLCQLKLTNWKPQPPIMGFTSIMDAGGQNLGFYDPKSKIVYIHNDLANGISPMLIQTIVEEFAHHITGSTDMSRDFQDYAFRAFTAIFMENNK